MGRLEFKAFDSCPEPALYGELLSLLTGLVLDTTLAQRRTTPDAALHRHAARVGYADVAPRSVPQPWTQLFQDGPALTRTDAGQAASGAADAS